MVLGYHCDEFNSVGGFFQVRQSHAHAWVEVYFGPDEIQDEGLSAREQSLGAWLRLDPTPSGSGGAGPADSPLARIDHAMNYVQFLWRDYVLDFGDDSNNENDPTGADMGLGVGGDRRNWLQQLLAPQPGEENASIVADGRLWIVGAVVALLAFGLIAMRILRGRGGRRGGKTKTKRAAGPEIEFYARLVRLLQQHGILRGPAETQREFADATRQRLLAMGVSNAAAGVPDEIAAAYYEARFGRRPVGDDATGRLHRAIEELQAAIDGRPK